jgi:hypothetical protein
MAVWVRHAAEKHFQEDWWVRNADLPTACREELVLHKKQLLNEEISHSGEQEIIRPTRVGCFRESSFVCGGNF